MIKSNILNLIIIGLPVLYFFFMVFTMKTHNFLSSILFKFIPFLLSLGLLYLFLILNSNIINF